MFQYSLGFPCVRTCENIGLSVGKQFLLIKRIKRKEYICLFSFLVRQKLKVVAVFKAMDVPKYLQ